MSDINNSQIYFGSFVNLARAIKILKKFLKEMDLINKQKKRKNTHRFVNIPNKPALKNVNILPKEFHKERKELDSFKVYRPSSMN